uniref:DNA excision repair protein ERCC-1 n=2 Tax=Canis lupus familiaris TaxID=9615 RepID=A0A8I3NG29_CANLF
MLSDLSPSCRDGGHSPSGQRKGFLLGLEGALPFCLGSRGTLISSMKRNTTQESMVPLVTLSSFPRGPHLFTLSVPTAQGWSQRGNPVLKFVRNVAWEFGDVLPDYVLGQSTCALFLSLRYHNLHPDYLHERLQSLGKSFALRVLLVQVDMKDPQQALKELAKMCILAYCTLVLAWSPEEAGRYLETYKAYEQKPANLLMEKLEQDFVSRVTECLTTVKSVNKTDSQTLLTTFGSLEQLMTASREDLALCPGLGPQKAWRLFDVLHEPFLKVPR